jgi:hypothetical protein
MSKISYCSLEEAWGDSYSQKNKINNSNNEEIDNKKDTNNKLYDRNKYDKLIENSQEDMNNIVENMNKIERNNSSENNKIIEYDKYRFNPKNTVKQNNYDNTYTPFNESIEKKFLQDKINYLENEFMKYKYQMDNSETNNSNSIEHFSNDSSSSNNMSNKDSDFVDLIILIIIGLMVIFVLNSIFSIGKAIGARNKI